MAAHHVRAKADGKAVGRMRPVVAVVAGPGNGNALTGCRGTGGYVAHVATPVPLWIRAAGTHLADRGQAATAIASPRARVATPGSAATSARERETGERRAKRCGVFPSCCRGGTAEEAKSCIHLQIGYSDPMAGQVVSGCTKKPKHGSLTACWDFERRDGLLDRLVGVVGRHQVLR